MRCLLAILLLCGVAAPALAGISIQERFFEDRNRSLSAEEVVRQLDSLPWSETRLSNPNFGHTLSRIWFRFRIPEMAVEHGPNGPLILEIQSAYLEKVGFYVISGGKILRFSRAGMGVPVSVRDADVLQSGWPQFRVNGPRNSEAEYLISIEGRYPLSLPLSIMEAPEFAHHNWAGMLFLGFFLGCVALAAVFNGFIALALRSRLYLYYSLYVGFMFLMCAADAGLTEQLLWPDWPWWAIREMHVMGGITIFFYAAFVRNFVASRRVAPWLDRALVAAVAVSSLRSILVLFWYDLRITIPGEIAVVCCNFLVLAIGVQAFRKRVPSARFFLVSSVTFNVGYIVYMFQMSNLLWIGDIVTHAPQVGIALEVCLLSLALADRIRLANVELARQKEANVQADKLSALGRMAGEIAHEIANPLAIIHGNAVLIRKSAELPQVQDFAGTIEQTANRISKVVKGMRALARDSRRDPFQPVPLESIMQDAYALCEERARLRGVRMTVPQLEASTALYCRGSEVCQVLVNLLNNALDAVEGQTDPWVQVEARLVGRLMEISVSDSGAGVAPEIRSRIQEPFFTTKEAGKGLGLGLSISRTIVEHHGGTLRLDEASPRTRFVFTVPVPA